VTYERPGSLFLRRLIGRERRSSERHALSWLVAYYWDGGVPVAHGVRDISLTGMYLLTGDRWYVGTVIQMTLQETGDADVHAERWIAVQARVVRQGSDGVSLAFLPQSSGGMAELLNRAPTDPWRKL
jgi:hypothetical protein